MLQNARFTGFSIPELVNENPQIRINTYPASVWLYGFRLAKSEKSIVKYSCSKNNDNRICTTEFS